MKLDRQLLGVREPCVICVECDRCHHCEQCGGCIVRVKQVTENGTQTAFFDDVGDHVPNRVILTARRRPVITHELAPVQQHRLLAARERREKKERRRERRQYLQSNDKQN